MFTLIRSNSIRTLLPEQYEFYDHWYYAALRELVEIIPVYENNIQSVIGRLNPALKLREAQQALKVLERLHLVVKDCDGRYHRTETVISCGDGIRSVAIRNFQKAMIGQAMHALDNVPRNERDFSTITLSIDGPAWEVVKSKLAACRIELLERASKVKTPDRIIQLNFQGFPLTQRTPDAVETDREENR
jgi:uncharacterized protein (TIGR02147 family)